MIIYIMKMSLTFTYVLCKRSSLSTISLHFKILYIVIGVVQQRVFIFEFLTGVVGGGYGGAVVGWWSRSMANQKPVLNDGLVIVG